MKRIIPLLLTFALIVSCLSTSAFAADYITSVESTTEPTYVLSIPATISLNTDSQLNITALQLILEEDTQLVVYVDQACLMDSSLYMYMDEVSNAGYVSALLSTSTSAPFAPIADNNYVAATFQSGSTVAVSGGTISFIGDWSMANALGTYTGALNFICTIEDVE